MWHGTQDTDTSHDQDDGQDTVSGGGHGHTPPHPLPGVGALVAEGQRQEAGQSQAGDRRQPGEVVLWPHVHPAHHHLVRHHARLQHYKRHRGEDQGWGDSSQEQTKTRADTTARKSLIPGSVIADNVDTFKQKKSEGR